jgi:hypothetical protein
MHLGRAEVRIAELGLYLDASVFAMVRPHVRHAPASAGGGVPCHVLWGLERVLHDAKCGRGAGRSFSALLKLRLTAPYPLIHHPI